RYAHANRGFRVRKTPVAPLQVARAVLGDKGGLVLRPGPDLCQALDLLRHLLVTWTGTCRTCRQPTPRQPTASPPHGTT
ncbi:hypothetical protein, partial [Streptomyces sp. NPDC059744]|uniref:hypothetical protein n=1 Tax=Streptomyces sp. NPDC059744 TaxID=3346929 RepID=UPI00365FFA77